MRPLFLRSLFLASAACLLSASLVAGQARSIEVWSHRGYLPGIPVLVVVKVKAPSGEIDRSLWDAEAALTAAQAGVSLSPSKVTLRNGLGSALVAIQAPAGTTSISVAAAIGELMAVRQIESFEAKPVVTVSGELTSDLTEWDGVVRVTGDVTVPEGKTLRILPGTLVLVEGVAGGEDQPGNCLSRADTPDRCGTSIYVKGTLESLGTAEDPVSITAADPARAWGEIHHDGAAPSVYRHTAITRAGHSPYYNEGHTLTGPSVRLTDSKVQMEGSAIADGAGKAMQASGSDLVFHDGLMARVIMGPEIDGTALDFQRSYIQETYGTDDNDGIYLHNQKAGQTIALVDSVFAAGDDDGIDTLGSTIAVENCIVRDFGATGTDADSKGISVFHGEVAVTRCLVVGVPQGIVAKGTNRGAVVRVERTTVATTDIDEAVGIFAWDKYGAPEDLPIEFFVVDSIVRSRTAVATDYRASDIHVRYTDLSTAWDGEGNKTADPLFVDAAAGDYRLAEGSPCVDAGDPASSPDPDGTRADMGCFPRDQSSATVRFARGYVNADKKRDIGDAIAILMYLFGGSSTSCLDAADVNDDGSLNITDPVNLLSYLFLGGDPPAEPAESCAFDPTADALGCAAAQCP